jgi:hypothetical protein
MEATDGLSLGGELEASRENSSGSSSWQSTASSSFVAVIVVPSALRLQRQRMRQSSVPCGKTSGGLRDSVEKSVTDCGANPLS